VASSESEVPKAMIGIGLRDENVQPAAGLPTETIE
jgi:hypothetical protein